MLSRLEYRPDVDGLRTVAVLSVVLFHAFPEFLRGGFVGVDIFFVISGFLISRIIFCELRRSQFSFAGFYARRVRRLFPSLAIVLFAALCLGWFLLPPHLYRPLGMQALAGAAFFSNVLDWRQGSYFDSGHRALLHLWSLGIEEQFYIVWPIVLWVAWRFRARPLLVVASIAVASFWMNIYLTHADARGDFYLPQARFWELLIGSLLACHDLSKFSPVTTQAFHPSTSNSTSHTTWKQRAPNVSSSLGLATIFVSVALINRQMAFPGWWALLPTMGTGLILLAGPTAWINAKILSNRLSVGLGLISFQLYLWHWPILFFLQAYSDAFPSVGLRALALLCTVLLAWLTWNFIDKPIRYGDRPRVQTLSACAALVLTGMLGYAVFALNGFPSRYPLGYQELAAFQYSRQIPYREGSCFLLPWQTSSDFGSCLDDVASTTSKTRTILLWGDSYAAHLYPGLKHALTSSIRLFQYTASGCPPIVDVAFGTRPSCKEINEYVVQQAMRHPPDSVILAAEWEVYDWKLLVNTLQRLKSAGVRSINIVGPVPEWNGSLIESIYKYLRKAPDPGVVPQRLGFGLMPKPRETDSEMAVFFSRMSVTYVSALDILCNENGCLSRTGDRLDTLTTWDSGHLTTFGSIYLVSHSGLARPE